MDKRKRIQSLEIKKVELSIDDLNEQIARNNSILYECETEIKKNISKIDDSQMRQGLTELWFKTIDNEQKNLMTCGRKKKSSSLLSQYNDIDDRPKHSQQQNLYHQTHHRAASYKPNSTKPNYDDFHYHHHREHDNNFNIYHQTHHQGARYKQRSSNPNFDHNNYHLTHHQGARNKQSSPNQKYDDNNYHHHRKNHNNSNIYNNYHHRQEPHNNSNTNHKYSNFNSSNNNWRNRNSHPNMTEHQVSNLGEILCRNLMSLVEQNDSNNHNFLGISNQQIHQRNQ